MKLLQLNVFLNYMKIGAFEFSLREFAGSLGDFGTLIPFVAGYILVNGFDPAGLLIMLGLTNIILALVYRLPHPVQPKKAIGNISHSREMDTWHGVWNRTKSRHFLALARGFKKNKPSV